ncbi:MAG: penicillin-binding protein 2 [Sedimentisphaerales bacterium]|nr:penicillin-binding protein 2 [Sedimentisphaerales bacterium]
MGLRSLIDGIAATVAPGPPGARREQITIVVLLGLVVLALFALGWRCFCLQYSRGDYYAGKCMDQQLAYVPLEPQRGAILDCRGRVLAASNQFRTIFAEPRIVREPRDTSNRLATMLDTPAHEVCKTIMESHNQGYVPIKVGASAVECEAVRPIQGIGIQYGWQRYYPTGRLTSHVIGFTSVDNRGLAGVEFGYDRELRGQGATNTFYVDVHRRPIAFCLQSQQDRDLPINGAGILLTLDATIQQFAREELVRQYKAYEAEGAVAVVVDVKSGAILAMVSLPDFDPADARRTDPNHFYNRVLTDTYEPGSIIKPVVAAIALDTGVVSRYETIFCENGHYYGKGFGSIGEYKQGFGDLTLKEIIAKSSNIGMAKIGQRLGPTRLYEGLTLFGYGRRVSMGLPGEAEGLLRPTKDWTGYSPTRIPFGQEINVTAMQMVRAFCMLANGGRLCRPYIIKAFVHPDGTTVDMRPSEPQLGYVIKPEVAKWIVSQAMVAVVKEGTGTRAKLDEWQVFGKSGTAQLAKPGSRGYEEKAYMASFVAGAPADDPRVIVLVSIRRPNVALRKGYTGGTVAAPVAAAILGKTLHYLEGTQLLPDKRVVDRTPAATPVSYNPEADDMSW